MATTWAVLLPSRGPALSFALAAFFALGALLAGGAFLLAFPLAGAPLAACAPPLAFLVALDFAGFSSGFAASPSPWMRSQMRLAAALGGFEGSQGPGARGAFPRGSGGPGGP